MTKEELIDRLEARDITLSYSSIKAFMQSPRHFIDYKLKKRAATKAMDEGTMVDLFLTEPDKADSHFAVIPSDCVLNSADGVKAYAKFLGIPVPEWKDRSTVVNAALESDPREFIPAEAKQRCKEIAEAVRKNPASKWIFDMPGIEQHPVQFEAFGWNWRGFRDKYVPEFFIADYKKTSDAAVRKFHRQMVALRYPLQAAIYTVGPGEILPYYIVAYDNGCHVSVTELQEVTIRAEWDKLERVMDRFERCIVLGEWHKSYDFWPEAHGIYTF